MQVFEIRVQFRTGPKDFEIAEITSDRIRKPSAQGCNRCQLSRNILYAREGVDSRNQPFVNLQIHLHSASPSMLPGSQSSLTGGALRRTIVRIIEATERCRATSGTASPGRLAGQVC